MNIRLDGKRALVTGGSSGIGEAIALALGEAGAKVAINYRTHPEAAQNVAQRIQAQAGAPLVLPADVSRPAEVAEMFRRIDQAWGGIDVLINNAGIDGERAMSWEASPDAWKKVIEVKDLLTKIPLNRIGEPEEIARMAVVLVSDVASYVTGRTIFVDGGMTDYPSFAHGG